MLLEPHPEGSGMKSYAVTMDPAQTDDLGGERPGHKAAVARDARALAIGLIAVCFTNQYTDRHQSEKVQCVET